MTIKSPPRKYTSQQSGAMQGIQQLATRTGINNETSGLESVAGFATRMQHVLPYGAISAALVYPGWTTTVSGSDAEVMLNTGGWACTGAVPVAGGASYAVGDLIVPTVATNQFAPTLQVTAVSAGAVTALAVVAQGGFGTAPSTGLATTHLTGGGNDALTVTLTVQPIAFPVEVGLEQSWGTQTAFSATNTSGVKKVTKGANARGGEGNIAIPQGGLVMTDFLQLDLPAGSTIGTRLYSPGNGMYGGRYLSGSTNLNEYGHGNVTLANNTPYGGTFGTSTSPAGGFQPVGIFGIPQVPGVTVGIVGDSIGYGTISVPSATGGTTAHDALDAATDPYALSGFIERAFGNQYPLQQFGSPSDQIAFWLSQTGAPLRLQTISWPVPPTILYCEMQINDIVTGAVSYATLKAYLLAHWQQLMGTGAREIWQETCTPCPTTTQGLAAVPTIGAAGSGYAASSTFNVTLAGGTGTAAVVNVTSNAGGSIATINSITAIGYYSALPTNNVATVATQGGSGLTLVCSFAGCLDQASQTVNSANTVIQAINSDYRSRASWIPSYVTRIIDLGSSVESSVGNGLWPSGASADAKHPTQAWLPTITTQIAPQLTGATL